MTLREQRPEIQLQKATGEIGNTKLLITLEAPDPLPWNQLQPVSALRLPTPGSPYPDFEISGQIQPWTGITTTDRQRVTAGS